MAVGPAFLSHVRCRVRFLQQDLTSREELNKALSWSGPHWARWQGFGEAEVCNDLWIWVHHFRSWTSGRFFKFPKPPSFHLPKGDNNKRLTELLCLANSRNSAKVSCLLSPWWQAFWVGLPGIPKLRHLECPQKCKCETCLLPDCSPDQDVLRTSYHDHQSCSMQLGWHPHLF